MKRNQIWFLILTLGLILAADFPFVATATAETCAKWVAKVVSIQGRVEAQRAGGRGWQPVELYDTYCPGDTIRVQKQSRAAIVLRNESTLRLDQKTAVTFAEPDKEQTFLLNILSGAGHFFSRKPRRLRVITPFVNAAVEGTEFFVEVARDQTFLSILEGQVVVTNQAGHLTLARGQSAIAKAGQAPALHVVVRPRDAVQWALYYPPIVDFQPTDFSAETGWQAMVRRSIRFYHQGDLAMAFASIAEAPEVIRDPRFFIFRAALLLAVGRVDEARIDIKKALTLDPHPSHAVALQSVIAVVQNHKGDALDLAQQAVELDPESSAARVALSYARQAHFDLQGALNSLQEAVRLAPEDALAWARLAELWLAFGRLKQAFRTARKAVELQPNLAHTQTVLGFAFLTQIKTRKARNAFEKAIELDQAAPLPRLGLGLAKIREGRLQEGRSEIEIAVSLDPNTSLLRSYLGKSFYEEKRDKLAKDQLDTAKKLDPLDPTPWFYDAIRQLTVNRPVEALQDLEKSIALNENRAVYRSRLLLDEDLAARSAALGSIYNELGFQQRALVEGWTSLNVDPSNFSAHRFLADSYAALPRHDVARVSELLQSQLLQPINITPIQPRLAESNLFILQGAGPADASFNEFNSLFNRNRFALQANGMVGGNNTWGDQVVFSGIAGLLSYSVGQFRFKTDGFRDNNDQEHDIHNAFIQVSLSPTTSVQTELRVTDLEKGDLPLRFDPENFNPELRQEEKTRSVRLGFHHAFTPSSDLIASFIYRQGDFDTGTSNFDAEVKDDGFMIEVQHLYRSERLDVIGGVGHFDADEDSEINTRVFLPPPFGVIEDTRASKTDIRHTNLYIYTHLHYPRNVTWTIGGSADFFDGAVVDRDQFNPKFGLTWTPFPGTTLRAAVFRVLTRTLISNQTIEPTQVAGFNQFFDDGNGTESWRYGGAIDQTFLAALHGGIEFSRRELKVPFTAVNIEAGTSEVSKADWEENLGHAYLYWTPHPWLAASGEYQYERLKRDKTFVGEDEFTRVTTHRVALGLNFFHPSGLFARLRTTYLDQDGRFGDPRGGVVEPGDDQFWVVDSALGYRLPKRYGIVSLEVKNLFDEDFRFQDTDPTNPSIQPERFVFARFTLAF